jgi:hypothetical protein
VWWLEFHRLRWISEDFSSWYLGHCILKCSYQLRYVARETRQVLFLFIIIIIFEFKRSTYLPSIYIFFNLCIKYA